MLRLVKRLLAPAIVMAALVALPLASAQAHHPHCGPGGYGYGGYGAGFRGYGPGYGGYGVGYPGVYGGGYGYRVARPYGYFPNQPGVFGGYNNYYRGPGINFYSGPGGFGFSRW